VDNYDIRWEYYAARGNNISASFFYKKFRNHIEMVKSVGLTWQNVDDSYVAGLELEGKRKLLKNLELRANVSIVRSRTEFVRKRLDLSDGVKVYYPIDTVSRPMFGQSPYVFNAILTYTVDKIGFSATASYNIQGPRLVIAADVKEIPDIYELPRNLIDLKFSKTINKHFTAGVAIKDLLNSPIRRSYKYDEGFDLDFDRFRFGTVIQASISYKL
jgi:outer membrane receptor protein involved in Fe transport